jgi:hypothetical protein
VWQLWCMAKAAVTVCPCDRTLFAPWKRLEVCVWPWLQLDSGHNSLWLTDETVTHPPSVMSVQPFKVCRGPLWVCQIARLSCRHHLTAKKCGDWMRLLRIQLLNMFTCDWISCTRHDSQLKHVWTRVPSTLTRRVTNKVVWACLANSSWTFDSFWNWFLFRCDTRLTKRIRLTFQSVQSLLLSLNCSCRMFNNYFNLFWKLRQRSQIQRIFGTVCNCPHLQLLNKAKVTL